MTAKTPLTEIKVPLAFPVTVKAADGNDAKRDSITLRRPKTRHVKRVAALIGADLLGSLIGDSGTAIKSAGTVKPEQVALDVGKLLLTTANLDEVTSILADMCGESPALIDDLDPVDMLELAKAFASFFPTLLSALSSSGQQS